MLQSIENVPNFQLQMLQNYQAPEIQAPNRAKEGEIPKFAPNFQQNAPNENQSPNFVPNFQQIAPKGNKVPKFAPAKKNPNFIAKQISLKKPVPPDMVRDIKFEIWKIHLETPWLIFFST